MDTIKNLLLKLATCQQMAQYWRSECEALLLDPTEDNQDHELDLKNRNWKALTLVTDAYGEWHETDAAIDILHNAL